MSLEEPAHAYCPQRNAKQKVSRISLLVSIKPEAEQGQALQEVIFQNTFVIGHCMGRQH